MPETPAATDTNQSATTVKTQNIKEISVAC